MSPAKKSAGKKTTKTPAARKKGAAKKSAGKKTSTKKSTARKAGAKKKAPAAKKKPTISTAAAKKKTTASKAAAKKKTTASKAAAKKKTTASKAAAKKKTGKKTAAEAKPAPPPKPGALVVARGKLASKLGVRWVCYACGAVFYDLNKPRPICPKCQADQSTAPKESRKDDSPPPKRDTMRALRVLDEEDAPVRDDDSDAETLELDLELGTDERLLDAAADAESDED
jgi:hypothetical protein